jgi:threonine synthase
LFHHQFGELKNMLSSVSILDDETIKTIKEVFEKEDYLLDPHGAVGYLALQRYLKEHPEQKGYLLETAHPVKFYDVVEPVIQRKIPIPESVKGILSKEKLSTVMETGFQNLNEFLLNR